MSTSDRKRVRDQARGSAGSVGRGTTRKERPVRDCHRLYSSTITYNCAIRRGCVPCAYKICCFDVALDKEFSTLVPNQRPELCPRSSDKKGLVGTFGYEPAMSILTVGDGDFSFSLAIARILPGAEVVATSYESRETLVSVYPSVVSTLAELESLGAKVYFRVDGTQLATTLPCQSSFHRIVWNFPCEAVSKGRDGQNEEMERNKVLVRDFVASARHLLLRQGQIHINHKTKPPFNQWRIEDVAMLKGKDSPQAYYYGRIVFDRYLFPPYVPRKALDRKSFPSHDACTYVFGVEPNGDPLADAVELFDENRTTNPKSVVVVNKDLVQQIRRALMESKAARKRPKRQAVKVK